MERTRYWGSAHRGVHRTDPATREVRTAGRGFAARGEGGRRKAAGGPHCWPRLRSSRSFIVASYAQSIATRTPETVACVTFWACNSF
jgi:hypothetical protein